MSDFIQSLPDGAVLLYSAITAVSAFVGWVIGRIKKN